ncbi:3'-5' exoribonuclease domain-containing protein [Streptomyces sp. NPDC059568]|uniref:3'-5' exoribonuclease domain-containing protein n=1 Tax=Streptomyces sp. NPDC059568 TaxID=3346868 RepID=UPI0036BCCA04
MKIFYDTEFLDTGRVIDLISIGMVAEDGRELYAVSGEFDQNAVRRHGWLMANVWPSLPTRRHEGTRCATCRPSGPGHLDLDHPDVRSRKQIARMVAEFIGDTPAPELWAYYAAYDHVAMAQLWGPMSSLPGWIPMQTDDLVTEAKRLGLTPGNLPAQADGHHNALADARHNLAMAEYLTEVARDR